MRTRTGAQVFFLRKMEDWFDSYAKKRLGIFTPLPLEHECVEFCIAAMESGDLPVCSKNLYGNYLWSTYFLTPGDWIRICRLRPPLNLLWGLSSKIVVSCDDADYVAALRQIDYLWQDLEVVQPYAAIYSKSWISEEFKLRVSWSKELRRAWIAAVVMTI